MECGYLKKEVYERIYLEYEKIIGMIVMIMQHPEKWSFKV